MAFRRPTEAEQRLIGELASRARLEDADVWLGALQVEEMDDGGMGSLRLGGRECSGVVVRKAEVQFTDEDGVEVIASLNAGADGVPLELDIWRTDFAPLIRIPETFASSGKDPTRR